MHDFDYDAMQKKRIARGAMHMKRGSKSKKCGLPHDGLTAAQLRRLNGPVSTYKMDEPMTKESFKAMPEDLQKQYIRGLQETYQATDEMLGKMFGVSAVTVLGWRRKLDVGALSNNRIPRSESAIRDAKWEAFCNGVVGGKPGEPGEPKVVEEPVIEEDVVLVSVDDVVKIDTDEPIPGVPEYVRVDRVHRIETDPNIIDDPIEIRKLKDELEKAIEKAYAPVPSRLDVTYIEEIADMNDLKRIVQTLHIPTGKCKIRISIEAL